jgi:hypothetical protein
LLLDLNLTETSHFGEAGTKQNFPSHLPLMERHFVFVPSRSLSFSLPLPPYLPLFPSPSPLLSSPLLFSAIFSSLCDSSTRQWREEKNRKARTESLDWQEHNRELRGY